MIHLMEHVFRLCSNRRDAQRLRAFGKQDFSIRENSEDCAPPPQYKLTGKAQHATGTL